MTLRILVLEGDGIGPEITAATLDVLRAADAKFSLGFSFEKADVGWVAHKAVGTTFPDAVEVAAKAADGVLLGPVSHNDYPPRADFFRSELEQYLLLARENGYPPLSLKGSYAGAMGIAQFMPSSQRYYAVDFDGDQRIDLARSSADAIGSVARYLQLHGWEAGAQIAMPANVDGDPTALLSADYKPRLPLRELLQQGVSAAVETEQFGDRPAALIDLVGPAQPTEYWIAFDNFYVITRYNHSTFYAMAVFQLAQALRAERSRTTE